MLVGRFGQLKPLEDRTWRTISSASSAPSTTSMSASRSSRTIPSRVSIESSGDDYAHRTPLGYAPLQDETPADRAEPILERNEERRSLRTVVLDGDAVANSLERHVAISTLAPDGSDFTEVITGGFNPHWSPDGSRSRTRCQPGARRTQEEPLSRWPTRTARTFGCSTSAA